MKSSCLGLLVGLPIGISSTLAGDAVRTNYFTASSPDSAVRWQQQAREKLPELFGRAGGMSEKHWKTEQDRLYQQIGRLQVEVDWLRKKSKALGLM